MRLFGKEIRLPSLGLRERFKGYFDTGYAVRRQGRKFYSGEHHWRQRCKHYDQLYERHPIVKQALLTLAGQVIAEGIFVKEASIEPPHQSRAEEAQQKCEDLNKRLRIKTMIRETALNMGKYGSCFWEKTWTPQFDARVIPGQEFIEPVELNDVGEVIRWRQTHFGQTIAEWSSDEIIHFAWDVTSQSWPYGTSLLVGLETECEILETMEQNIRDYTEKQAWPYEVLQLGDGQYTPTDTEIDTVKSKWRNRKIGENLISTYPTELKQGGTGEAPLQQLHNLLNFIKDNIIDGTMVPPISKQWSSTMASATEMMPWARANIIQPIQAIISEKIEDELYKPYLEDLGFSVKLCPTLEWEHPDAHMDEHMEVWAMAVQSGICPPEYAAEQLGFDMDKIQQYEQERLRREAEQQQLYKVSPLNPKQSVAPKVKQEEE